MEPQVFRSGWGYVPGALFGLVGGIFVVQGFLGAFTWEDSRRPAGPLLPVSLGTVAILVGIYGILWSRNRRLVLDEWGIRCFDFLGRKTLSSAWKEIRSMHIERGDAERTDRLVVSVGAHQVFVEFTFSDESRLIRCLQSQLGDRFSPSLKLRNTRQGG